MALAAGTLPPADRAEALLHLDECAACREVVAEAASLEADAKRPNQTPTQARVGRYTLTGMLGTGGMGVVYRAFDPLLQREVALKLIRSTVAAQGQLLREAQSMAKLSHPNVVGVYDAGVHEDQVFIAMEYVDGRTLRKWLRERTDSWRETLRVLIEAGRGLAAAHRVGLIHGDIKPENILLGGTGLAKITDFGGARFATGAPQRSATDPVPEDSEFITVFTDHGECVGTPAYMTPEQLAGEELGPWSDQFSFCVTAYEALLGKRPFAGNSIEPLLRNIMDGRIEETPRTAVPPKVVAILLRGLSRQPPSRHPSLEALLEALQAAASGPTALSGRRPLVITAALALLGAATFWAWNRSPTAQRSSAEPAAPVAVHQPQPAAIEPSPARAPAETQALVQPPPPAAAPAAAPARPAPKPSHSKPPHLRSLAAKRRPKTPPGRLPTPAETGDDLMAPKYLTPAGH